MQTKRERDPLTFYQMYYWHSKHVMGAEVAASMWAILLLFVSLIMWAVCDEYANKIIQIGEFVPFSF